MNDLDHKLYLILNSVLYTASFDVWELMFVFNLILNMATGGEFYFLVEKYLFCKDCVIYSSVPSQKKSLTAISNNFLLTQTVIEKDKTSKPDKQNDQIEKIINNFDSEKSPNVANLQEKGKTTQKPFFFRLISTNLDSKTPLADSSSSLIKPNKNFQIITKPSEDESPLKEKTTSPDRRSKKSFTVTSASVRTHQKRPSALMATHYARDIEISQAFDNYSTNFADISKYIRIKIPYFIDMIIRFLYEIPNLANTLKQFYLAVLKNMIPDNSCYNSAFISRDFCIMRLLLCLRLEKEDLLRDEINKSLILILENYMNNHQLKAIFNLLHYNLSLQDYCQSQMTKNRTRNRSKILERSQITSLFSGDISFYTNSLTCHENFFTSTQSLLKLLLNLIKESSKTEKSHKILNFSGQNSGIVITNMRFPINGFTILLDLTIDNLLTTDKREMPGIYHSSQNIDIKNNNKLVLSPDHLIHCQWPKDKNLDGHYLSPSKLSSQNSMHMKKFIDKEEQKSTGNIKYTPRIFTLTSHDSSCYLDVYITEKRELNIELLDKARTSLISETFKCHFEERKLYKLLINYSNEQFQVFLGEDELISNKLNFPKLHEKFLHPKYFSLCCSPLKSIDHKTKTQDLKKLIPLTIENSLSGTISGFKLIDKPITPKEINQISTYRSLSLNIFEFLLKHNFMSENNWVSLVKSEPCSIENQQVFVEERAKSRLDFMNKLIRKIKDVGSQVSLHKISNNLVENQPFDVKCKGVSFLEKICFLDFFLMFGNVEVFFYMIDSLATEFDFIDTEKS